MNLLFLGTPEDKPYLHRLKQAIGPNHKCGLYLDKVDMLREAAMLANSKGATHIITTQQALIPKLCSTASIKEQTIDNYAGSVLYDSTNKLTYLIVHPLKRTISVAHGQFVLDRMVSKFTQPKKWLTTDTFSWKLCSFGNDYVELYEKIQEALLVAIDIETRKDLSISSISYTAVYKDAITGFKTYTAVVPLPYGLSAGDYEYCYAWIAKYNATKTSKVLQNGKYDIAYLNRYGCPIVNWFWDTAACHHSWYSELEKDLGTLGAFYIRNSIFWKNEGDSGDEMEGYRYNALDTWYTAWVLLGWLHEAPKWALENYKQEFPVLIPCVLSEAIGIKADEQEFDRLYKLKSDEAERERRELGANLATPSFNPGSPKQVGQLLKALGCKDIKTTGEKDLKKAAYRHPFNQWVIAKVFKYRKAAKLVSTYLNKDKLFNGRLLYTLSPYGTKTGRLASANHAFWCGFQIQNIPRDGGIKSYLVADPGFLIGEADYAQAESRDTGYITGDTVLIAAVDGPNDFHSFNASAFFGIPYEQICVNNPDGTFKILDKEIRQLSKPVNHGKNYNMGDEVLVDTMGLENIFKAARRLKLPTTYTAKQIAAYLGKCFANTYKVVTGDYHDWVKYTIANTRLLIGATGWTRYCFGDPSKSKLDLNAYLAHSPQSLNAMTLNKAYVKVFWEVWVPNWQNFKLCAQIHDSILFQYREGHEYLADMVKDCMEMDIVVPDIKGVKRTLRVPVDISLGGKSWQDSKDH